MIKRLGVFASVLAAVFAIGVSADMVWGNNFFDRIEKRTRKLKRNSFIIDSPDGYVIPQQKPGETKDFVSTKWNPEKAALPIFKNGNVLHITNVYIHKGEYWGVMPMSHHYDWPGWVLMNRLLSLYTTEDFETDNKHKFCKYDGNYDTIISAEKVILWEWPGSDREKRIVNEKYLAQTISSCQKTYRDGEDREWCGVYYWAEFMGYISGWICLSDPENKSNIPAFNPAPKPAKWSPNDIKEKR